MSRESTKDWDKLFSQVPVDVTVSIDKREELKRRACEVFDCRPRPKTRLTIQSIGYVLMKYKIPYGMAAMLVLAVLFWTVLSNSPTVFALDVMIENLMTAKSARYNVTVITEGQPPIKLQGYYLEPCHMREEFGGYVTISDWEARKKIGLDTNLKRATVFELSNQPEEMKNGLQDGNWFEGIRQVLRTANSDSKSKVVSLGESQIRGRKVVGFRFEWTGPAISLWADSVTQLPVRMESTFDGPPKTDVVISDFEFNIELDPLLFSVDVPQGYTAEHVNVDLSAPSESELIQALAMCAEVTDGQFPTGFDAFSMGKYAATYLHKKGIDAKSATGEQLQQTVKIARGFQFVLALPTESNAHYAGEGARLGAADRPILWYKPKGSTKYRVIYADLFVAELPNPPASDNAIRLKK